MLKTVIDQLQAFWSVQGNIRRRYKRQRHRHRHRHTLAACEALSGKNTACFETKSVDGAIADLHQVAQIATAVGHQTARLPHTAFAFSLQNRR